MNLLLSVSLVLVLSGLGAASTFPDCENGPLSGNEVCNTSASTVSRAKALVDAMTLEEKFNQTGNTAAGVSRLGLPPYQWWSEALHGVANSPGVVFAPSGDISYATSFPQPILIGAAFDDQLVQDIASVVSTECRAFNNYNHSGLDYWTPNINPFKDPRWGRGQETPGEDVHHLKSYVASLIKGLEDGEDPSIKKVIATCKHWVAYDLENWEGNDRTAFDAKVSIQDMAEFYAQPFQTCARDSNVGSFMCSYNAVDGIPTCADPYLFEILRNHWDWSADEQYVTSDCDAVQNIFTPHNYTSDPEQAVADALNAGTDLDCGTFYPQYLPSAYARGLFNESTLDKSLTRLYAALVTLGYFNPASSTPYRSYNFDNVSTSSSQALALQAAEEGVVLLKNDGSLPLQLSDTNETKIAIVGSWANATDQLQGNYFGKAPYLRSPLYAIQQIPNVVVSYAAGISSNSFSASADWQEAMNATKDADIILIADGIDNSDEAEGKDRIDISWPAAKVQLFEQLAGQGKPTILLQFGGGQLDDTPFLTNKNITSIVWGGYPGQDGGTAVVNIVFGKTSPAGRLPITQYPANYVQQIPMTDMSLRPGSSTPGRTYRWFNESVLPFGHGLHYTNFSVTFQDIRQTKRAGGSIDFEIADLLSACKEKHLDLCPLTSVAVQVHNTGPVTSDFVTLGFISSTQSAAPEPHPLKTLVAYQRLFNIAPDQSQFANLELSFASLGRHDENGDLYLYPGTYHLLVDEPTAVTMDIVLNGQPQKLDTWPQRGS